VRRHRCDSPRQTVARSTIAIVETKRPQHTDTCRVPGGTQSPLLPMVAGNCCRRLMLANPGRRRIPHALPEKQTADRSNFHAAGIPRNSGNVWKGSVDIHRFVGLDFICCWTERNGCESHRERTGRRLSPVAAVSSVRSRQSGADLWRETRAGCGSAAFAAGKVRGGRQRWAAGDDEKPAGRARCRSPLKLCYFGNPGAGGPCSSLATGSQNQPSGQICRACADCAVRAPADRPGGERGGERGLLRISRVRCKRELRPPGRTRQAGVPVPSTGGRVKPPSRKGPYQDT